MRRLVGRTWREFLRTYDSRRYDFEARHPELRTVRLVILFGSVAVAFPIIWAEITIGLLVLAASAFLGLLVYGVVRWREDRVLGQVMLAVGWPGLPVAAGAGMNFAMCAATSIESPTCGSFPGVAVVGASWLVLWLAVGLCLDYFLWVYGQLPEEGDLGP